jgi:hypothetical protein
MSDVFPDSVVLDGIKNEKKVFWCTTERAKIARDGPSTTTVGPQLHSL